MRAESAAVLGLSILSVLGATQAGADTPALACGKVASQIDAVLSQQPPGAVTTLRPKLLECIRSHRICGVVYDQTEQFAHVFSGERSSDVATLEYFANGASYAFMASRSLPRSPKSGLEYCLALTPGGGSDHGEFDWYGWQISATGEVRMLDLAGEASFGIRTNPRSLAIAIWNFYTKNYVPAGRNGTESAE
ncbi:MAG: hypothetical protein JWM63_1192 [Gammaproteobacteria bacterium]|jgi:hypothetical protein|nr:hypothetical protein [Gammaproteobacteria bacterium]